MKVKDLIKQLEGYNGDIDVVICGGSGDYANVVKSVVGTYWEGIFDIDRGYIGTSGKRYATIELRCQETAKYSNFLDSEGENDAD